MRLTLGNQNQSNISLEYYDDLMYKVSLSYLDISTHALHWVRRFLSQTIYA